ncbi:hypothetical protein LTR36_004153 [Oleoguttula mirabilis]|uniref:BTB domain-containing protein n=1 Tax=Oleoguttula mirabilis TaxID=1507867 RepID=A0AAV9JH73_9PEZI|nr:hypothetical protein LTR36_004153 [Oleoguttula mirabilis]
MPRNFDVTGFFDQEAFSDVTVKFGTRERKCHKMILCSTSQYFNDLCGPGKSFAESSQLVVELKDDDEEAVEAMLRWLYTFDYEKRAGVEKQGPTLNFHLNVYVVSDKYLLAALQEESINPLQSDLEATEEDELVAFIQEVCYGHQSFPQAVMDVVDKARDGRLDVLLEHSAFRDMMLRDPELCLSVVDKLQTKMNAKDGVMRDLVEKRYSKCVCKREELGDKLVPGTTYFCGKRNCSRPLAVKQCWVKRGAWV